MICCTPSCDLYRGLGDFMGELATTATAPDQGDDRITIRTSETGWFERLAKAYKDHTPVALIDDANVGINPKTQLLWEMGRKAHLTVPEWTAVLVALGMTLAGAAMVIAAILDPEPTSKLWLLIASGAILVFGGGWGAIRVLTKVKPPRVKVGPGGIEIDWS